MSIIMDVIKGTSSHMGVKMSENFELLFNDFLVCIKISNSGRADFVLDY